MNNPKYQPGEHNGEHGRHVSAKHTLDDASKTDLFAQWDDNAQANKSDRARAKVAESRSSV